MRTFRAYLLNPAGKIVWGEWIEAADLKQAETLAHSLCKEGTPVVELWEGPKRLANVPCDEDEPIERTTAGQAG